MPGAPAPGPAHWWSRLGREERVLAGLLIFVPLTILASRLGWPSSVVFFLSVAAVIPLAGFIAAATEQLAERTGGKIGGLLNATFGNAPDLLVGIFGVQKGLIPLVKATLVGAIISNSALVMGLCCVAAGIVHRRPTFDRREAGHHSILMMLTVAAVLFPTAGAWVVCGGNHCGGAQAHSILGVSVGIAVILLLTYVAYILYGVFGLEGRNREAEGRSRRLVQRTGEAQRRGWPLAVSLGVLAGATLLLLPVTDTLTGSVTAVTDLLGWTQVFVGMIVVANAGNVAEAYAAIRFAVERRGRTDDGEESGLDLSLGIASASSIQIAAFVTPVVVLYSLATHPMNLVFSGVEIAILGLLVIIFSAIAQDGESNWLEGAELLALYAMAGVLFFALPVSAFQ